MLIKTVLNNDLKFVAKRWVVNVIFVRDFIHLTKHE